MSYVPLWVKSNFSFLEGASHPHELVDEAHRLGLPALAVTDRDGLYGIVRAHVRAKELGIKLLIGSQVTLTDGSAIIFLVQNREGYRNLCRLLTKGRLRSPKGESRVSWREVCEHAGGLLALWGGDQSLLVREAELLLVAKRLSEAFGDRLYALLTRHWHAEEVAQEIRLRERAPRYGIPLVAGTEVLYHSASRRPLQDVVTCIRHGVTLSGAGTLTKPNDRHNLPGAEAFAALFADVPEAIERTREVADRCDFSLSEIRYVYPTERLPSGMSSLDWLRELTMQGAKNHYGEVPEAVRTQVEKELAVIDALDYPGYFLTMYEIVAYCQANDILCQGRGSAANSAVCYCLGITAVDPARTNLLFERFLSMERNEPPDIDLDIQHGRREEVIQHVYGKYGRDRAAMVANIIRYRPKSAVREVGKVLSISETTLDRLAKFFSHNRTVTEETLAELGLDPSARAHQLLIELANEIQDFPRHLSIHPGGFLLGHEPVHDLVPIENATMGNRTVIQWDKEDVEALGLFKVDLLGLGALTQLDLAFKMLKAHRGVGLTIATIPSGDEATYAMLQRADTVGVFQIESRAQMSMLPRLRPKNFYDLVIEISIVRPGPISGGMVHPYLKRRNGEEPVAYPHECLRPVLEKTKGIPLFQEQVMSLAIVAADYTPGEADQLRRDMAAWKRTGNMERHRERLKSRMLAKGITEEFAERVYKQIQGFGSYGFPESHAASFALIAYATAWLKCHYPAEFAASLLNAQPMGFYSPATIVEDAKRHSVEVHPVCALASVWDCTLEPTSKDFAVRMGLRYVKGFRESDYERIEVVRGQRPFSSLEDFTQRTRLKEGSLVRLAEAGAFEGLGLSRRDALWQVRSLARTTQQSLPLSYETTVPTFTKLSDFETVGWDYGSTSHSPRGHPLTGMRAELERQGLPDARTLERIPHGRRASYAGLVICRQRPGTAKGVVFMTMEDETGFVNLVIWQNVFEKYRVMVKTRSLLGVTGKIQNSEGVTHLVAEKFWVPELPAEPERVRSRDFH